MTREEAINVLKGMKHALKERDFKSEHEALNVAIEALKADTVPIEKYHELQHQFVMLGATFTDLTEVVRCKDCKWYKHIGCAIRIVDDSDRPKDNDYCSFGERREP